MSEPAIIVYGANWCGDCHRTKRLLDNHNITYRWVDIEQDVSGEQFVLSTNRGMRSIPTILFEDGLILVEPSNTILAQKLGINK